MVPPRPKTRAAAPAPAAGAAHGHAPGDIDRLVHEPARLVVLSLLAVVDAADATFLVNQTGLTWGNLASHLTKLEGAGYVQVEKTHRDRRPCTLLRLTGPGRAALDAYRRVLRDVLDSLPG